MSLYTVSKSISIKAPCSRIYRALTSNEEITTFYRLVRVEGAWQEGNAVNFVGQMDGALYTDFGVVEKLDENRLIAYRYWGENHDTERLDENYIAISYTLEDLDGHARVTMKQSNIKSKPLYEALDEHICELLLNRLKVYLETP